MNPIPTRALEVLRYIRGWCNSLSASGRLCTTGPTARDLYAAFLGRRGSAREGLAILKARRLVCWTPEGNRTRYTPAKVKRQ